MVRCNIYYILYSIVKVDNMCYYKGYDEMRIEKYNTALKKLTA